jgi:alpha-glucosidase
VAWYKAGCLFPFFRNHACAGTADQEPWVFGPEALETIRHHVRLRYKLLPYFYQLWNDQERDGTAVMRPLFYDFSNADGIELDWVDDQFLIGPAIMQAPIVQQGQQSRFVTLPGTGRWMDANTGQFLSAARIIHVNSSADRTPIYLREGSLLPMQPGVRTHNDCDLSDIELHVILGTGSLDEATLDYVTDDGLTYAYQRGERSVYRLRVRRVGNTLELYANALQTGWRPLTLRVAGYDGADRLLVNVGGVLSALPLVSNPWRMSGDELPVALSEAIRI